MIQRATCHRRRSQPDTAGHKRFFLIEWNRVFIAGDVDFIQQGFRFLACNLIGRFHIGQDEMIIRAAGYDPQSFLLERFAESLAICDNLARIVNKFRFQRFAEAHGFSSDHMHQRAALDSREDVAIEILGKFLLAKNNAAARTAQGFMCCGRDEMGIRHRAHVKPCRD